MTAKHAINGLWVDCTSFFRKFSHDDLHITEFDLIDFMSVKLNSQLSVIFLCKFVSYAFNSSNHFNFNIKYLNCVTCSSVFNTISMLKFNN